MLYTILKKYDKLLNYKKNLDGSISIFRVSPFNTSKEHIILTIQNKYIGSGSWVINRLIHMDTTRYDLFGKAKRNNFNIRNEKQSRNIHEDLADYIVGGGFTFIN